MPIGFGSVAASDLSIEFNRGVTTFDIWYARNGYYGGINDASGYRPTVSGNGYAYSDWRGYFHNASRPYVYIFKYESQASCSIRLYKYNVYGGADWSERWYFYNTGPWTDAAGSAPGLGPAAGVRTSERITFLWNHFGWGNPWKTTYKAVYSPYRGTFISWGCDPAIYQRYAEVSGVISGEPFYVYSVEYYC
jgi:hypothetical protein